MAKKEVVKKVVAKKVAVKKSDMLKLLEIFKEIKKLMKAYEPPFSARVDIEGKYDLWSEKTVKAFGREYDSMMFVSIIIQSGYVGFYYLPIYAEPGLSKNFNADFMKLLKGKSCFHVKGLNKDTLSQIAKALKIGYTGYKKLKWI